jgi:hypothetical protein
MTGAQVWCSVSSVVSVALVFRDDDDDDDDDEEEADDEFFPDIGGGKYNKMS